MLGVRHGRPQEVAVNPVLLLQMEIQALRTDIGAQMGEFRNTLSTAQEGVGTRLLDNTKAIGEVRESLGKLEGATARILEVGQGVSRLEKVLRPPSLRGSLGEFLLEELIAQILPKEYYEMQYRFGSGEIVDAVIRLPVGLLPVDAKFPLDAFQDMISCDNQDERRRRRKDFQNAVKAQASDIAKKYIQPDENTLNLAFMYIPAENVYYEVILRDKDDAGLLKHCSQCRVFPVSPMSFYAHLQALAIGLRGLRIEENVQVVLNMLEQLRGDLTRFEGDFEVLGTHVRNANNKYQDAQHRLALFSNQLGNIERLPADSDQQTPLPPNER